MYIIFQFKGNRDARNNRFYTTQMWLKYKKAPAKITGAEIRKIQRWFR